jgi:[protein-PII] uridylyltransferase
LAGRREQIRQRHDAGAKGGEIAAEFTELIDGVIARLVRSALDDMGRTAAGDFESNFAIVATGGYGRGELAPFSDIDLLLLYQPEVTGTAERFAERFVQDIWDSRLELGHSVRTIAECTRLARGDVSIHTALLEARHVVGSPYLTGALNEATARLTERRRGDRFIAAAAAARATEQAKFGSTVHLLEPDVKKTKGGLRELHLFRWVAHAKHRTADIERLELAGALSDEDAAMLRDARQFVLRVRNELHFQAGRAQDTLGWDEQIRIARRFGYNDRPGELAVEQFMRDYYRHTTGIADVVNRFVTRSRSHGHFARWFRPVLARGVGDGLVISMGEIAATEPARHRLVADLSHTMQLFRLAQTHRCRIEYETFERVRQHAADPNGSVPPAAIATFLDMLREPVYLSETLEQLHAARILERLLPDFRHAYCRIQFNQYHKYTIDEHTLLAVAKAAALHGDGGPFGRAYAEIRHKEILHLALLLHDLGKGHTEDHSELGRRIAQRTAAEFGLDASHGDTLAFLVHQHLLMSALAFTRDITDPALVDRFARDVGTPERLRLLYVLTVCDIQAVGPEAWTTWKADLLSELYGRTMEQLTGERPLLHPEERVAAARAAVRQRAGTALPIDWLAPHLAAMPASYLLATPVESIVEHLGMLHQLPPREVRAAGRWDPANGTVEFTICTYDDLTPGIFSKIAGVLAAKGLQILGAQISTHHDGAVLDRFQVVDYDYAAGPPRERLDDISKTIRRVLLGEQTVQSLFQSHRRVGSRHAPTAPPVQPTEVRIDNDTSDGSTIVEVFAADRQGLLFVITHTLFQLGLSVSLSKITTRLDQILDVFYVTDPCGQKITGERRLEQVRSRLIAAIERFEQTGEFPLE